MTTKNIKEQAIKQFREKFGNTWDYTQEHTDFWLSIIDRTIAEREEELREFFNILLSKYSEDRPVPPAVIRKELDKLLSNNTQEDLTNK